jgi:nucleoid-associated protein YgaU
VDLGSRGSVKRCLLVWACASSALSGVGRLAGPPARAGASAVTQHRLDAVPLDRALVDLAAVLLLACAAWLWLETSYVVIEAGRGRGPDAAPGLEPGLEPSLRRGLQHGLGPSGRAPSIMRRMVLSACGIAVAGALAQPAVGATVDVSRTAHRPPRVVRTSVTGLPLPERADVGGGPRSLVRNGPPRTTSSVVVAPGDSLWSIAASTLPEGTPDAVIARRWRAIYAANRDRIGADPDLIVPGLRLDLPRRDLP